MTIFIRQIGVTAYPTLPRSRSSGSSPPAAPHLGKLLIGEAMRTAILLLHQFCHMSDICLPLRRPSQDPIEDFLLLLLVMPSSYHVGSCLR
jgi:hypothetical protein